ncbi:MAG: hypothetical protein ACOCRX_03330 [Candidatus Woesearchaeota archaeon]
MKKIVEHILSECEMYLRDIEEISGKMEEQDKIVVRSFQNESIEKRIELIKNNIKRIKKMEVKKDDN